MAHKAEQSSEEKAPLWIMSFGDMVTNLLAFFMIIQSFSKSQESGFLYAGQNSMVAIGPAEGSGKKFVGNPPPFGWGNPRPLFPTEGDEDNLTPERIIDAEDEKNRQIFDDIRKAMDTDVADGSREAQRVFPMPARFAAASTDLPPEARDFLAAFAVDFQQAYTEASIYVIGMAPDAADAKTQFMLSARRAEAAREFLAQCLPAAGFARRGLDEREQESVGPRTRISAWGIGSGREGRRALATAQPPHVVVIVVENRTR